MKSTKKLLALLLALVMVLSLSVSALATPTGSTAVDSIDGVTSITVNGATAYYEKDSTSASQVYIRASVTGGTEYDLKNATVVVNRSSISTTVTSTDMTFTGVLARTASGVNLFNNACTITINGTSYIIAAGLPSGTVGISPSDPLRVTALTASSATGTISASNVQNPYMGNTTLAGSEWTFIKYTISASSGSISDRSNVTATLNIPTGTSAPTANSCVLQAVTGSGSAQTTALDLSDPAPKMKITSGSDSREYYVFVTGGSTFTVSYGINFYEALNSTYYTGTVKTAVDTLNEQAKEYFGTTVGTENSYAYGTITVTAGETVMDIMHKFAVKYGYTSEVPEGCTYMATLNGIGEFDFGSMSGWMYTNTPAWNAAGEALYTTWFTPPIGGADYTLSDGDEICWFICTDYTHHPWQS